LPSQVTKKLVPFLKILLISFSFTLFVGILSGLNDSRGQGPHFLHQVFTPPLSCLAT
jgi:hypothetical protein